VGFFFNFSKSCDDCLSFHSAFFILHSFLISFSRYFFAVAFLVYFIFLFLWLSLPAAANSNFPTYASKLLGNMHLSMLPHPRYPLPFQLPLPVPYCQPKVSSFLSPQPGHVFHAHTCLFALAIKSSACRANISTLTSLRSLSLSVSLSASLSLSLSALSVSLGIESPIHCAVLLLYFCSWYFTLVFRVWFHFVTLFIYFSAFTSATILLLPQGGKQRRKGRKDERVSARVCHVNNVDNSR